MKTIDTPSKAYKAGSARSGLLILAWLLLALALASCLPEGNKGSSQKGPGPADWVEHPQLARGSRTDFIDPDRDENALGQELPDACAFLGPGQAGELLDKAVQEKILSPAEREAWAGSIEKNGTGWIWQCSSTVVPV